MLPWEMFRLSRELSEIMSIAGLHVNYMVFQDALFGARDTK